jgi:type II secretory pathway component PulF
LPTYRYKALQANGTLIYGTEDADSPAALGESLQRIGLKLDWQEEIALHLSIRRAGAQLPRLVQLRVGERIRESILTGMPVHHAMRAVAAEPFDHPVMMLFPWLILSCGLVTVAGILLHYSVPGVSPWLYGVSLLAIPLLIILRRVLRYQLEQRPQTFLEQTATALESGSELASVSGHLLPPEYQAVSQSGLGADACGRTMTELQPVLAANAVARSKVAARISGPAVMATLLSLGFAAFMIGAVPVFRGIFEEFAIELPALTTLFLSISDTLAIPGWSALPIIALVQFSLIFFLSGLIVSPSAGHLTSRIPLVGSSVHSLTQARFCSLLAALLRNGAAPADAVRVAGTGSGDRKLQQETETVSQQLIDAGMELSAGKSLTGLPLNLLQIPSATADQRNRSEVADVFSGIAAALEQAAGGHSSLAVILLEVLLVTGTGFLVALFVLAFYQPLFSQLSAFMLVLSAANLTQGTRE